MELSESQGGGLAAKSAQIFRGQSYMLLAQWSGRGGGKTLWKFRRDEGLGFVSRGRRLPAAAKVLVRLQQRVQLTASLV